MPLVFKNTNHDKNCRTIFILKPLSLSLNLELNKQQSLLIYVFIKKEDRFFKLCVEVVVRDRICGLPIDEKSAEEEEWSDAEIIFVAEDYIYAVEEAREASDDECCYQRRSDRTAKPFNALVSC